MISLINGEVIYINNQGDNNIDLARDAILFAKNKIGHENNLFLLYKEAINYINGK